MAASPGADLPVGWALSNEKSPDEMAASPGAGLLVGWALSSIMIPKFHVLTKMSMYLNNKNISNFTFLDIFEFQEKKYFVLEETILQHTWVSLNSVWFHAFS